MEYFKNAFDWIKTKPQIDTTKLFVLGISRGAELALELGSIYPQIKGVIAYSPSCFILPNATEIENDSLIASWTLRGHPISFAPISRFKESNAKAINYYTYIKPLLEQNNLPVESIIKVEKINGPLLLISGAQDLVWPASDMAIRIENRLKEYNFKHEVKNIIFQDGGHDLFMFKDCYPVVSGILPKRFKLNIRGQDYEFNLGGTTLGVMKSKIQSRKIALHFLDSLKSKKQD